MQTDGSLVMYRQDGTKRYGMAKNGNIAIMQGDGNFVQYSNSWHPLWNTETGGNPNAYLHIQDDGNLVVYGPTGIPLWNIGAESTANDPTQIGDVVGRDLDVAGLGWLGHIAIWDSEQVIEANSGSYNAIRLRSLNQYKSESPYWGKATWKLPNELTEPYCYYSFCPDFGGTQALWARLAAVRRAMQIYQIGSDYTTTIFTVPATAQTERVPARRGSYRCDTFVLAALQASTRYQQPFSAAALEWYYRYESLDDNGITPRLIFDKLRTFQ
ncbi:hypothetical protein [Massilia cavernae]|uniref:Bulb-type lectin domain-containing protein n=1 Tax=Massilia cavernae TaxID=2320864 RepID=A0A418X7K2_9BURK|nr:hypothetical protein [Massilia cavernae]RJG08421.1 hypothetical protein D3872_24000 [Massilia cavernae]